jgi:hypothetical protein
MRSSSHSLYVWGRFSRIPDHLGHLLHDLRKPRERLATRAYRHDDFARFAAQSPRGREPVARVADDMRR